MGLQIGARALLKVHTGDLEQEADVSLASVPNSHATVTGAEAGAVGAEFGFGLNMPISEESSLFLDLSADIRSSSQNLNASVGYRLSF